MGDCDLECGMGMCFDLTLEEYERTDNVCTMSFDNERECTLGNVSDTMMKQ